MIIMPVEFLFTATAPIQFAPGEAANVFRGTLGALLHANPVAQPLSPASGFQDPPKPFVLRAAALDQASLIQGQPFTLPINFFDPNAIEAVTEALGRLATSTLRLRATLIEARPLPVVELPLTAPTHPVTAIRVEFLTPTELKAEGKALRRPDFPVLFNRARDRISTLCTLYQQGAPDIDYAPIGERAQAVVTTKFTLRQIEVARTSRRTGRTHSIGGFTGEADYAGDLAEFLPWLEAAQWTGVGRLTPWGNGWIRVVANP